MGPSALRIAGLGERIAAIGRVVVDQGNVTAPIRELAREGDAHKKYIDEIAAVCRRVHAMTRASLDAGALPVVIGGDHSVAAGSVAASAEAVRTTTGKPLGVIWVDAHGDMNTPQTSESGNVHGMPLAAARSAAGGAVGDRHAAVARPSTPCSWASAIWTIARRIDPRRRLHVFTMKDVDRDGIAQVAERAIAPASQGTWRPARFVDLGVCDPSVAPGVGTPCAAASTTAAHADGARGGSQRLVAPTWRSEPGADVRNTTAEFAVELALSTRQTDYLTYGTSFSISSMTVFMRAMVRVSGSSVVMSTPASRSRSIGYLDPPRVRNVR